MALLGAQFVNAVSPNPVGSLQAYAGANAPSGWLMCDGASYSTSVYPELFSVLSYTYGGSGASFNVPDLRGRVPVGKDNMGTTGTAGRMTTGATGSPTWTGSPTTLGSSAGTDKHTLTTAQMPSHNHAPPSGGQFWSETGSFLFAGGSTYRGAGSGNTTTTSAGSDNAHPNVQPVLVTNYIIKAVSDAPRSGLAYGSTPPIVTALPANPQFGDVVTYIADAANGVAWNLQYDASGTYPWKFVGGAPLYNSGGGGSVTSGSYVDAGGASLVVPLAGDFLVDFRCHFQLASTETGYLSVYLGTTAVDGDAAYSYSSASNPDGEMARVLRKTLATAGTTVKTQARLSAGGPRTWTTFQLGITPVRVKAA